MWSRPWWILIACTTLKLLPSALSDKDEEDDSLSCSAGRGYHRRYNRPLTPDDLPPVRLFQNWKNSTVVISNQSHASSTRTYEVSSGTIKQAGNGDYVSNFDLLHDVVHPHEYEKILELLNVEWLQSALDIDPDSVDGYATQEFFLDNDNLRSGESGKPGYEFPAHFEARKELRAALLNITKPILEERITPYVNHRFPGCKECAPCHSLIRRYVHGQRQSHFPHRDGHAFVTAVVGLSNHGEEYLGGLYVASGVSNPYYLGMRKGDVAIHQSDLLHGVKVYPIVDESGSKKSIRWSWILWFKDDLECKDHSYKWSASCAQHGNPTCAMMHANAVGRTPGISRHDEILQVSQWNYRAAELGQPTACVKLARQLLGKFPSLMQPSREKAMEYFKRAIDTSNDPDAHYGVATMYLQDAASLENKSKSNNLVQRAVQHLEASAIGGNPYAMFNLGITHLFGYGGAKDPQLAGDWFEASGLPEGFAARSFYFSSVGNAEAAEEFKQRALLLGYNTPWRTAALEYTGYGGAAGADFNLPWPPNEENSVPPTW